MKYCLKKQVLLKLELEIIFRIYLLQNVIYINISVKIKEAFLFRAIRIKVHKKTKKKIFIFINLQNEVLRMFSTELKVFQILCFVVFFICLHLYCTSVTPVCNDNNYSVNLVGWWFINNDKPNQTELLMHLHLLKLLCCHSWQYERHCHNMNTSDSKSWKCASLPCTVTDCNINFTFSLQINWSWLFLVSNQFQVILYYKT